MYLCSWGDNRRFGGKQ